MKRSLRLLALCALVFVTASCAGKKGPSPEYVNQLDGMSEAQLIHEYQSLKSELAFLKLRKKELLSEEGDGVSIKLSHMETLEQEASLRFDHLEARLLDAGVSITEKRYELPPTASTKNTVPELVIERTVKAAPSEQQPEPVQPDLPPTLSDISWKNNGNSLTISISTTRPSPDIRVFTMSNPARIVADISGMTEPTPPAGTVEVEGNKAHRIRMGWHPSRSVIRVVIDAKGTAIPSFYREATPNGIDLTIQ